VGTTEVIVGIVDVAVLAALVLSMINARWPDTVDRWNCDHCWRSYSNLRALKIHQSIEHPSPLEDHEHGVVTTYEPAALPVVVPLGERDPSELPLIEEPKQEVVVISNGQKFKIISGGKK
jgi:hypothetical protein